MVCCICCVVCIAVWCALEYFGVRRCALLCVAVHWCALLCIAVRWCAWVCVAVRCCAWVCVGVRGCALLCVGVQAGGERFGERLGCYLISSHLRSIERRQTAPRLLPRLGLTVLLYFTLLVLYAYWWYTQTCVRVCASVLYACMRVYAECCARVCVCVLNAVRVCACVCRCTQCVAGSARALSVPALLAAGFPAGPIGTQVM